MLLVDPLKRITIPEIRQHPWFTVHLPRYLAVMQESVSCIPQIDEDVVQDVVKMGFEREVLVEALKNRQQNKSTVAYWLLHDSRRNKVTEGGYLSSDMPDLQHPEGMMLTQQQGHRHARGHHQRLIAERRWRLGTCVRGHPSVIMADIYAILRKLGILWKKLAPYNLKCLKMVELMPQSGEDSKMVVDEVDQNVKEIKFEIQLYKYRDEEYMIDLQNLSGELYLFMDLCGKIMWQIG
eukprot:TRINITY_DN4301_c0_g2_i1.p4 TRINITY_DN4301_c0_g2~~TRINITY_DN4301_c0_g2_i1.p4  ORF type:complete len:237 (-),score=33.85 TRINITY_DN4301_c0_g2_i1:340-1050(-)